MTDEAIPWIDGSSHLCLLWQTIVDVASTVDDAAAAASVNLYWFLHHVNVECSTEIGSTHLKWVSYLSFFYRLLHSKANWIYLHIVIDR